MYILYQRPVDHHADLDKKIADKFSNLTETSVCSVDPIANPKISNAHQLERLLLSHVHINCTHRGWIGIAGLLQNGRL